MHEVWSWAFTGPGGASLAAQEHEALTDSGFPTQAEAEAWLGESWPDLAAAGVHAVTLKRDDVEVYGPMSLDPPESSGGSW